MPATAHRTAISRRISAPAATLSEVVDRDTEVGGGIIAGALAYRLFVWLLPFALVLVAGLGIAAGAASSSPQDAARSLGLAGLVSSSVASAAQSQTRWYALLVGVPVLLFATRSLLRTLIGAHRLVWGDPRRASPLPTPAETLRLLGLFFTFLLVSAAAGAARAASPAGGVLVSLFLLAPYAGLWLLASVRLPHGGAPWPALVPGALFFAVGLELLQLATAYVIAPMSLAKQGTYGALGIAAALLLGLFLLSRIIVLAAVLNATLSARR